MNSAIFVVSSINEYNYPFFIILVLPTHFQRIQLTIALKYFGYDPETSENRLCFLKTLQLVSRDSMKNSEDRMDRSLGGDQTDTDERHVRDGRTGKWREHFDDEVLKEVEKRLANFNLSLSHFNLGV